MEKIKYEILCDIPSVKKGEKYHYFYKIINEITGEYYYGVHSAKKLDDGYSGSSKKLKKDIKSQGICNFTKYIIKFFDNSDEMFKYEEKIVTKDVVLKKDCYNMHTGGSGSWDFTLGRVCVKDVFGNTKMVSKNDPAYISGELVSNMKNLIHVKTKDGENKTITKEEYYANKNKYNALISGYVLAKDEKGISSWIKKEDFDQLKLAGKAVGHTKNKGIFKDKNGNSLMCDVTDERVISGELVGFTKGLSVYKYKNDFSKVVVTTKDDPRVIRGELVGINYGIVHCINPVTKEKFSVPKDDPRIKTGEIITCVKYRNSTKPVIHAPRVTLEYYKEKYPVAMECIANKESYKEIQRKTGLTKKKIDYLRSRYKQLT